MEGGGYLLGRPENYDANELDNTEAAKWVCPRSMAYQHLSPGSLYIWLI